MLRTLAVIVALSVAGSAIAAPYELDAKGKCHDKANGQYAKQALCTAPAGAGVYKLNAAGKCIDEKGKYVKQDKCAGMSVPAPAKPAAAAKTATKK